MKKRKPLSEIACLLKQDKIEEECLLPKTYAEKKDLHFLCILRNEVF